MIGIILLNYNEWDLTVDCVDSIRNTTNTEYRIYIIDNGSATKTTDRFQEMIRKGKDIELIRSDVNLGYAGGNNIGISREEIKMHTILLKCSKSRDRLKSRSGSIH